MEFSVRKGGNFYYLYHTSTFTLIRLPSMKQSIAKLIETQGVLFTHFSFESWSSFSGAASSGTSPHHRNAGQGRGEASCAKEVAIPSWSSTVAWQRRAGQDAGNIVVKTKTERQVRKDDPIS